MTNVIQAPPTQLTTIKWFSEKHDLITSLAKATNNQTILKQYGTKKHFLKQFTKQPYDTEA